MNSFAKAVALASVVCSSIFLTAVLYTAPKTLTAQSTAASRNPVPAYTHGAADKMTVFLDFGDRLAGGGIPLSDAEVHHIFYRVAEYLNPSIGVTVTTSPPDSRPGEYVTVRVLGAATVSWRESAVGNGGVRFFRNTSWYAPNVCYAGTQSASPEWTAVIAAHEAVHNLQPDGFGHEETPVAGAYLNRNLMSASPGPGARLSPNMILAVSSHIEQLQDGWRMGSYLKTNGQWSFDYHKIDP